MINKNAESIEFLQSVADGYGCRLALVRDIEGGPDKFWLYSPLGTLYVTWIACGDVVEDDKKLHAGLEQLSIKALANV